jgi:hypothetical protein
MTATPGTDSPTNDDALTVCAISLLSAMIANVLHEGLGHGALALMTGAQSGVLTTVAWSSDFDSRLVAAGGTLANLAAGIVFWVALRSATGASVRLRFFLLTSVAFNLFVGTGYFFFRASPISATGQSSLPTCTRTGCGGRCSSSPEWRHTISPYWLWGLVS